MTTSFTSLLAAALCAIMLNTAWAAAPSPVADNEYKPQVGQAGKDVVWVPTDQALIDMMFRMAELTPDDYLVDLGSGDGRTVISAAKLGTRAHGIEYNPDLVELSKRAAANEGVAERATFEQADIFESDFSDATVVTLFLLPELNLKLRPTLLAMKPGTRVVSNSFMMEDWLPDETAAVHEGCASFCQAHKWIVPANVEGTWRLDNGDLAFTQSFQMLSGTLRRGENSTPISDARLNGAGITFNVGDRQYTGQVDGDTMKGTADDGTQWSATRTGG
ncbi:SAM-dependent methyltransferase [Brenneria roseae subsp. roseae]|uniref:SAM-dependent methyltransferase n=1 Tax=Brenneria roseae TaxID=1509241 RepID=UPI000D605C92|nr:methyltransferase domain-containing protein [Brenneria roseae]PWC23077.1 SAM-dependent methyltransferase [Brenneria roseae subsp. roseae]